MPKTNIGSGTKSSLLLIDTTMKYRAKISVIRDNLYLIHNAQQKMSMGSSLFILLKLVYEMSVSICVWNEDLFTVTL